MNCNSVTAYIGLGSNIGDRKENLDNAIELLDKEREIEVIAISSYINTSPVGYYDQPDFLNAAVGIKTTLSASALLGVCNNIEKYLKRERIIHWGPRTIDLDILLFSDSIINDDILIIPHPRMHEREFVLKPLNEIAPQAFHPVLEKPVSDLYRELKLMY